METLKNYKKLLQCCATCTFFNTDCVSESKKSAMKMDFCKVLEIYPKSQVQWMFGKDKCSKYKPAKPSNVKDFL